MTRHVLGKGPHRDLELDGIRGLAVAMVLAWHFIGIPAWSTEGWLPHIVFRIFLFGGAGVDLFFVLSGFLITRILITRKASDGRFLFAFYIRRALRILPPYLLLLGIFWGVLSAGVENHVFNGDIPLWRFLTFTQNYWMAQNATYGPDGISVTWSVAIEEQYYLVFPLLALMLPRRQLPIFLIATAIASIVWRAYIYKTDPGNNFPPDLGTLARLDGLAVGGIIAYAFDTARWQQYLRDHEAGLRRAMIYCICLLPLVNRASGSVMAYIGHTLLTLCFGLVIINLMLNLGSTAIWVRFLRSKKLIFLGGISYSLYLFHPIILATAFLLTGYSKTLSGWPQALILTGSLAVSILFSTITFKLFESRLIGLGRKLTY